MINLKAKMSMDNRGFVSGTEQAKGAVGRLTGSLGSMKGMLTAGLFAGAIAGMKALATSSMKTADDIMNWSARMGVSAKVVQELKIEADEAGIAFKGLMTGFGTLARTSQEALAGNKKYAESYEAMGLSMEKLQTMGQDEMFRSLADTVQNSSNRVETLGHLFNVLGGQAEKLLPILDSLGKRNEEVMSDTTVKVLDRTNDGWEKLKRSTKNVVGELTAAASTFGEELFGGGRGFFGNIGNAFRAFTFQDDPETGEKAQFKAIKKARERHKVNEEAKKKEIEGQAELKRKLRLQEEEAARKKNELEVAKNMERLEENNFNRRLKTLSVEQQIALLKEKIANAQERANAAGLGGDEVSMTEEMLNIDKLQTRIDSLNAKNSLAPLGRSLTPMQSVGALVSRAPFRTAVFEDQLRVQSSMDQHLMKLHRKLVLDQNLDNSGLIYD